MVGYSRIFMINVEQGCVQPGKASIANVFFPQLGRGSAEESCY